MARPLVLQLVMLLSLPGLQTATKRKLYVAARELGHIARPSFRVGIVGVLRSAAEHKPGRVALLGKLVRVLRPGVHSLRLQRVLVGSLGGSVLYGARPAK